MTKKEEHLESENARLRRLLAQAGLDAAASEVVSKLQKALIAELHHRVKNLLSMVRAITSQSIRSADSLEHAQDAIDSRIFALARSYDAIRTLGADSVPLAAIIETAVMPFNQGGRFTLAVPDFAISASSALAVSLVFNELSTNATKYGSLSVDAGEVHVDGATKDDSLTLIWTESGGPEVKSPAKRGFGSRMIEISIPDSEVDLDFRPDGLVCVMRIPFSSLNQPD